MAHGKINPDSPPISRIRPEDREPVRLRTNSTRPAVQCKGTSKSGERCKRWAMVGQQVCPIHGGRATQNRKAAEQRIAEEKARRMLVRLGEVTPVTNHLEALRQLAGEVIAFKDWCREQAEKVADCMRYESSMGIEQLRSEMALYERAQDRCAMVLTSLARVDIDSRLAAVEEAKALMMAEALSKSLAKAGVTGEVANIVRREFARRLVLIAEPENPAA